MLCAFCKTDSLNIGWDETSHLGKRPICYTCIGERDIRIMQTRRCIILFLKEDKKSWGRPVLVNSTSTIEFKVKERVEHPTHTSFVFLVNKKRWIGVMYHNCNRVLCRKYKL
jgi:hypothetical protein